MESSFSVAVKRGVVLPIPGPRDACYLPKRRKESKEEGGLFMGKRVL